MCLMIWKFQNVFDYFICMHRYLHQRQYHFAVLLNPNQDFRNMTSEDDEDNHETSSTADLSAYSSSELSEDTRERREAEAYDQVKEEREAFELIFEPAQLPWRSDVAVW